MRNLRLIAFLLSLALLAATAGTTRADDAAPAREPELHVFGCHALPTENAVALLRGNGFPEARALRALQDAYVGEGYLFAAMSVTQQADASYTVVVDEGERARVQSARVTGVRTRTEADVLAALELGVGAPFQPKRLARNI